MTITPIYYFDENHIFNTSYRQAFKNGFLNLETSYTEGYKRLDQVGRTVDQEIIFLLTIQVKEKYNFQK